MRGFEIVAVVIGVFFVVGIVAGMLLVVALPMLRHLRRGRRYMDGGDWRELPPTHEDDEKPPRWPGG